MTYRAGDDRTILMVVVGSRAYGLDGPGSDHDRRGVYVAPTDAYCEIDGPQGLTIFPRSTY